MHFKRNRLVYNNCAIIAAVFVCLCMKVYGRVLQSCIVYNHYQCQRLCWYRTPCVAFSIPADVTVARDGEVNCLLHTGATDGDILPQGWTLHTATHRDIHHACRTRPCTNSQICFPVSNLDPQFLCLEAPVDCGLPSPPVNGRAIWTGTSPGHVATLSCLQHYELFPKGTATEITCTEQGMWTTLEVSCRQVSYGDSPSVPFLIRLSFSLTLGWEACIKGRFLGGGQFIVNFLSDQEDYPNLAISNYHNVIAQLAFRDSMDGIIQSLLYSEKKSKIWIELGRVGGNPLTAGDPFRLTLNLNASCLNVVLHGTAFSTCLSWAGRVQLLSTVYIGIARSLQLDYVHLLSSQDCL